MFSYGTQNYQGQVSQRICQTAICICFDMCLADARLLLWHKDLTSPPRTSFAHTSHHLLTTALPPLLPTRTSFAPTTRFPLPLLTASRSHAAARSPSRSPNDLPSRWQICLASTRTITVADGHNVGCPLWSELGHHTRHHIPLVPHVSLPMPPRDTCQ